MTHLNDDELQIWADGEASDATQAAAWGAHVEQCSACAEKVASVRSLGHGLRLWADSVSHDAADDDLADRIWKTAAASATKTDTSPAVAEAKPAAPSNVVPMRGATRKRWVWGAMPIAVAAAAALVFAIKQPPRGTHGTRPPGNTVVHQTLPTPVEPDLAPDVDPGSEVLAVQTSDDHTTYSVLELQMKESGATTAVVWIDDRSEEGAGTVQ